MISIIYVEYDAYHSKNFVFETAADQDHWLIILTHTPAVFLVHGQMKEYPAHCVVIFPPKHKIFYRACADSYANDWLRFQSTEPLFTDSNSPPLGIPFLVSDPNYIHNIFRLLAPENFFQNEYKDLNLYYLIQLLINKLYEASLCNNNSPYYHALIDIRIKIYNSPGENWILSKIADDLHISISYLNKLYKNTFGISCIEDVIQARIFLAKEHLIRSSYSVSEISNLCGYNNSAHFFRQFRKFTGYTPLVFRNLNTKKIGTSAEHSKMTAIDKKDRY